MASKYPTQVLEFNDTVVRFVFVNGIRYFACKDVMRVLDYAKTSKSYQIFRRVDPENFDYFVVDCRGSAQTVRCIKEQALCVFLLKSYKAMAEELYAEIKNPDHVIRAFHADKSKKGILSQEQEMTEWHGLNLNKA